jgi:cyanophycin synthetase
MIEIRESRIFRGPSIWARVPVIYLLVDIGELEDRPTNLIPRFTDRLLDLLPSLVEHTCSRGRRGGFVERLHEGTWMAHVLEHVALALQDLTGVKVNRGKTRGTSERGVYTAVFAYAHEDVGQAAGVLAARLLNHLIYGTEPEFDFGKEVEDRIIRLAERFGYGPSTAAIVDEAERRGIPVLRLHPKRSLVQLGHGCHQRRIWATITSATSDIAVDIAGDKDLTNQVLRAVSIPSPGALLAFDVDEAERMAARIGYPVVLKPLDGNHGRGVCLSLADEAAVRRQFPSAAAESRRGAVIVEQFLSGKDYRVLVVGGQVVAVAERVPAHVRGDGLHTVRELIEIENADPRRGVGHEKALTRISVDAQTAETLRIQGLTLDDVPEPEQVVPLKLTGNMSTGGTAIDRTDEIHPDNAEIACQAALVVGLDVAGIDVISPDITRSLREAGGGVIEVNAAPGFRMHTHPTEGRPRDIG